MAALHGVVVTTAVHGTVTTDPHELVPSHGMVTETALQAVVMDVGPHRVEVEAAAYESKHRTALNALHAVHATVVVVEAGH